MKSKYIAVQRTLQWSSKKLVLQVGIPIRDPKTDWYCWLDIKLVPGKRVHHERVVGVDSWQAVQNAMFFAQNVIEERFQYAYAFEPHCGTGFPYIVQATLPYEYFKQLREHLKAECERKTEELFQELLRRRHETGTDLVY